MDKQQKERYEVDDEFIAQLNFLRDDHDKALETLKQQKRDIQKLLALLVEQDVPVPGDIADRYIRRAAGTDSSGAEELPFD